MGRAEGCLLQQVRFGVDKTDKFGEKIPNENTSWGDVQSYLIRSVVVCLGTTRSRLSQTFSIHKQAGAAGSASAVCSEEGAPARLRLAWHLCSVRLRGRQGITGRCPDGSHELSRGLRSLSCSPVPCPFKFLSGS